MEEGQSPRPRDELDVIFDEVAMKYAKMDEDSRRAGSPNDLLFREYAEIISTPQTPDPSE